MRHLSRLSPRSATRAGRVPAARTEAGRPAGDGRRSGGRLPSLTGLRFTAAAGVVFTHCALLSSPRLARTLGPEVWVGASAVSLFFILSGYVLTHSARPTDTARSFWRRRAAKILPNHVLTWCVVVGALAFAGTAASGAGSGMVAHLASLFLVNTWVPSERFLSAGNPVSWSLAAEGFFYLLFPVLLPWIRRLSRRGLLIGAVSAIALVWAGPVFSTLVLHPGGQLFSGRWFLYMLPVARLPEFVLGMIAARISAEGIPLPRIGVLPAALGVISAVIVNSSLLPHDFMYAASTVAPLVVLVHATAELDLRGGPSLLRTAPLVFLGEISYAMYLVHLVVLGLAYLGLTHLGWSALTAILVALPLVFLFSWLLYAGVERPCMQRFSTSRAHRGDRPHVSTTP
ncbi:acyltransferase [Streptomyces sp. NBRC 13847]|uniref:acyltransferase family protein n=1 Tax=Streptomyces TaxID=1883 RepID=UPI0024A2666B|nr:acyltransferase [Streptomyces sp. NBRC 13847]GLW14402.1 acyltransferase [Streptomyces sp. NBRC 13847]